MKESPSKAVWFKSSYSAGAAQCVQVKMNPDDATIAVRNSRYQDGMELVFTPEEWEAFIKGAREGEFNL